MGEASHPGPPEDPISDECFLAAATELHAAAGADIEADFASILSDGERRADTPDPFEDDALLCSAFRSCAEAARVADTDPYLEAEAGEQAEVVNLVDQDAETSAIQPEAARLSAPPPPVFGLGGWGVGADTAPLLPAMQDSDVISHSELPSEAGATTAAISMLRLAQRVAISSSDSAHAGASSTHLV